MIRSLTLKVALTGALVATLLTVASASARAAEITPDNQVNATGQVLRNDTGLYPRAVRLQYNGAANGRILASVVTFVSNADGVGAIYESTNDGGSFAQVGTVADPRAADGQGLCCATLFELPRQIGSMPAGTLLWAGSVGADARPMSLRIWRSNDLGRSWSYLSNCATAPNTRGMWEPEFSVAADGHLVCHYADETDSAHSQKLMEVRSSDGVTWTDRSPTVSSPTFGHRPGMPVVRQLPTGTYVMVYEICGLGGQYDCVVHTRTSANGWNWGAPSALGVRPQTIDGKYFTHAPTIAWAPSAGSPSGKLFLIGQILQNANGTVAPGNGRTIFVNTEGSNGRWHQLAAPVAVNNPYNNFCPNYSSPMVPSADGTRLLHLASDWDGGVCKTYFATGSGIATTNFFTYGSGIRVRSDARLNASVVITLPGPTAVYVECQKQGDTVTVEGHTNNWWSRLRDQRGFITNIYIDHPAAQLPGVPTC